MSTERNRQPPRQTVQHPARQAASPLLSPTASMDAHPIPIQAALRRLAALSPLDAPAGEPGIPSEGEAGVRRTCVPVVSVYLDVRPHGKAAQSGASPREVARLLIHERLHKLEQPFRPRGVAYATLQDAIVRIAQALAALNAQETRQPPILPEVQGMALFSSQPHDLFVRVDTQTPFDTQLSVSALPALFPLVRALDRSQQVVVALVAVNRARVVIVQGSAAREVFASQDDPKFYHMVHETNAMNQAHYQRHALAERRQFARQFARRIARLLSEGKQGVQGEIAAILLIGADEAVPLLRQALSTVRADLAPLIQEAPHSLALDAPLEAIQEVVTPLLTGAQRARDRALLERLTQGASPRQEAVVGQAATRRALQAGQVETLLLVDQLAPPPETSTELIALAIKSDATIAVIDSEETNKTEMGEDERAKLATALIQDGVGALLRYPLT